ncbi:MAG: DUF4058 family protein [Candidatus Anammoximicrobium sp.]|nr:DUF4058 family protein [Candidatus Anammoximicrobium sp.]
MPMHDWTRVSAGTYHDFHNSWITHLKEAFNAGLLPPAYYALGEQRSGGIDPDVITLRTEDAEPEDRGYTRYDDDGETGLVAVAEAPPRVRILQEAAEEVAFYLQRRRTLVIRHVSGDRIVALIEIVSPANKHAHQTLDAFVDKVVAALREGIHVLVVDPFPPTRRDPDGMHGAIWERLLAGDYQPPDDLPLTLVSYCVKHPITAYVEPFLVGSVLPEMPLFLTPERYVRTPLESTYMQAWAGVPNRWRRVIEHES